MDGGNPDSDLFEYNGGDDYDGGGKFGDMGKRVGQNLGQVAEGFGTAADGMNGIYSERDNIMSHRGAGFKTDDYIKVDGNKIKLGKKGKIVAAVLVVIVLVVVFIAYVVVPAVKKNEYLTVRFYEVTGIKPRNMRRLRRRNE
jgi:hypothetical protein